MIKRKPSFIFIEVLASRLRQGYGEVSPKRFARRRTLRSLSLVLASLSFFVAFSAFAQAPRPQEGEESAAAPLPRRTLEDEELLLRLAQQFVEAKALFDDPQRQSQSIDFLGRIIEEIEERRREGSEAAPEILELEHQALELRARAFFDAGQLQGAADDFRHLLLDNPRYALDTEFLSPKLVDFYEDQKKQLIGYIAVTTDPAGARVSVNGNFVGITNFFPVEVHTGLARIDITLEGYQSYVDDNLRIEPGEINTLDLVLTRVSARLPVITDPPGVEVVVGGKVVGMTSGTLPPDLRSFMPPNLDPSRLSAPFELMALPLGQHDIELRLDCYETVRFPFRADEPRDYTAQIVKLEESIGRVSVTSNPSDARVYLDGELKGNTPLELDRVCSGGHRLEVKHPTGKYVEDITVGADESLSFECPIRPTLAVLGFIAADGVPSRDLDDIQKKLGSELRGLSVMNVVFPEPGSIDALIGGGGVRSLLPSLAPESATPDHIRETSQKLGKALEVEAFLLGYVPAQRLTKDVVLHLLAVGSPAPDGYSLNYLDREALPAFVQRLSTPTKLFGSWIGLGSVDTRITEGPIVLAVDSDGPAARAGVQIGDIVQSVSGTQVTKALDLLRAVRAMEPGASLTLEVLRGGAPQSVTASVGTTPLEIPMNEQGFLYNKAIVDLRHRMVVEPAVAGLAGLNVALCYMQLGDYETALKEYLPQVTLPERTGISQGTVLYYTALAYLRLGERAEAARIFQQALAFEGATVHSNDGPRVTPLAQRRLREAGR
ncbi:MAG: PEGA domain-containing protein [Vicinamibacteria bacterium]